jgi:predicted TIM-barrel fold metal-dependent hydrolase
VLVDFHVHLPFDWEKRGISPKEATRRVLEWMDGNGVDVAVLLPIAPYISNDYVAEVVECEPVRLVGFASVVPNPADVAAEELKRAVRELGLKGLKLHPSMQGFCLRNPHVWRVLREAGILGVPVLIDAMLGDFSTLYFKAGPLSLNTVEDYSLLPVVAASTTLILAHMGGLYRFREIMEVATAANVYLDVSYSLVTIAGELGPAKLAKYFRVLGTEKFLFGSDTVIGATPEEYGVRAHLRVLEDMELSTRRTRSNPPRER